MRLAALTLQAVALATASAEATRLGSLKANVVPAGMCDSQPSEAGYFTIASNTNKNYFYWNFQSRSSTAATDPVYLWLTGGPGCSSSLALLSENGPCNVQPDGTTINNPYSWSGNAHAIYLDQPAGVGFSYADDSGYDSNEAEVSADAYRFLQAYFKAHPELQKNPFYVFGESYGGHYVPAVSAAIVNGNNNLAAGDVHINLAGIAIGNGLTVPLVQYPQYPVLAYNYSIEKLGYPVVPLATYNSMQKSVPTCVKLIAKCQNDTSSCAQAQSFCNDFLVGPYSATGLNPYNINQTCAVPPLCYDMSPEESYLNSAPVQTALGVISQGITWQPCNFEVNSAFSNDWMKDFGTNIVTVMNAGIRALIYAGDLDFICNWLGNQEMTKDLSWPGQAGFNAADMLPYMVDGVESGQVRSYQTLTFARIYNAGHMTPMDQPVVASAMINSFMNGQPLA